jgi:hypothetical protein
LRTKIMVLQHPLECRKVIARIASLPSSLALWPPDTHKLGLRMLDSVLRAGLADGEANVAEDDRDGAADTAVPRQR